MCAVSNVYFHTNISKYTKIFSQDRDWCWTDMWIPRLSELNWRHLGFLLILLRKCIHGPATREIKTFMVFWGVCALASVSMSIWEEGSTWEWKWYADVSLGDTFRVFLFQYLRDNWEMNVKEHLILHRYISI